MAAFLFLQLDWLCPPNRETKFLLLEVLKAPCFSLMPQLPQPKVTPSSGSDQDSLT